MLDRIIHKLKRNNRVFSSIYWDDKLKTPIIYLNGSINNAFFGEIAYQIKEDSVIFFGSRSDLNAQINGVEIFKGNNYNELIIICYLHAFNIKRKDLKSICQV